MKFEELKFKLAAPEPANVYIAPQVRIALLTDRAARFEYAADGVFEDRETLAVMNRDLGKVKFSVKKKSGWNVIDTGRMRISHKPDGKPFSSSNLRVEFECAGKSASWTPGTKDTGNLCGTIRTLDRCDGGFVVTRNKETYEEKRSKIKLGKGFLSRDGWSLIDDSSNVVVTRIGGKKWVAPRDEKTVQDLYLLAYGHDYRAALADAAEIFGSQPLPPRYALGYWYCRYWAYSDTEIEGILDSLDRSGTPVDVMVVDMDWHLDGWTGYTWDKRYFPDPDGFLKEMHRRGLKVSLNLHPADGVGKHEAKFAEFARAMKLDPKKIDRVPFDITSPEYMKHYFEILHHPEERRGVDFWWMDWQQGESTAMRGLDTLPWINHLHWEDMQKQHKRPLIFSRFGGVGAGRYVIGFSGDTYSDWISLQYQPYFTATSANVLYGYWSHDIGGHMPGPIEPELYLRWVQYGVFTPILRTHTTKCFLADRRFAAYPEPFSSLMSEAVRLRYELVPYIYSEDRRMMENGVSLVYPLYYDCPEDARAYTSKQEYFFGSQMLVSPVVDAVDPKSELAKVKVYLPAGEWYDTMRGRRLSGPCEYTDRCLYNEIPVFVRAGAVIPGQRDAKRLDEKSYSHLVVNVYPGASGSYDMYEDDGLTPDYLNKNHVYIRMSHAKSGNIRTVTVKKLKGDFAGFLAKREVEFRLHCVVPPDSVKVDGGAVAFCRRFEFAGKGAAWCYDGENATLKVRVPAADVVRGVTLKVAYPVADEFAPVENLRGNLNRLTRLATVANALQTAGLAKYADCDERLPQELAHTGVRLSIRPETWREELANIEKKLPKVARTMKILFENKKGRFNAHDNDWKFVQYPIACAMLKNIILK
jgi:alpha-glucosidase